MARHRQVVFKFQDSISFPNHVDDLGALLHGPALTSFHDLVLAFPGVITERLITSVSPDVLQRLETSAAARDPEYPPRNPWSYFAAYVPPGTNPQLVADHIANWSGIEYALVSPEIAPPGVAPIDDPLAAQQTYLDPAPEGVNARYAWQFTGGDGHDIDFIDVEAGWDLAHSDLQVKGNPIPLIAGVGSQVWNDIDHGTSVLGIICAVDNDKFCVGIAPNPGSVNVASYVYTTGGASAQNLANAIVAATNALKAGDVLLLEAEFVTGVVDQGNNPWNGMPVETDPTVYDKIRNAIANDIIVIEAAGNGDNDLTGFVDTKGRSLFDPSLASFSADDSHAILVGAAWKGCSHGLLSRMLAGTWGSNHSRRVDCHAVGEALTSLSAGNAPTFGFKGTSGAAAIIAGVALAIQGISKAQSGNVYKPAGLRDIFRDPMTATLPAPGDEKLIGVMPDLKKIVQKYLRVAADVYVRDFVGDNGDPNTGPLGVSPDIIVVSAPLADAQASYGEGSGTENTTGLGTTVIPGRDNYVYVRVRNRSGLQANQVIATAYWSPVATLVTPSTWTLIGSSVPASVPPGNLLTVLGPIRWAQTSIPGFGHYCFVAFVEAADDPLPPEKCVQDWDGFKYFIRSENNVTWHNFDVFIIGAMTGSAMAVDFMVPGAPDRPVLMRLEVVSNLPPEARMQVEASPGWLRRLGRPQRAFGELEGCEGSVTAHFRSGGPNLVVEGLFPPSSEFIPKLQLMVEIPDRMRDRAYEIAVLQLEGDLELGRVTWRLVPPD